MKKDWPAIEEPNKLDDIQDMIGSLIAEVSTLRVRLDRMDESQRVKRQMKHLTTKYNKAMFRIAKLEMKR